MKPTASDLRDKIRDPRRLAVLESTGLLDTPAEARFDVLTQRAASLLGVPATFISLVDRDRDFHKSASGPSGQWSEVRQLEGLTFCHYTLGAPSPLVIDDTARDPVYRHVPSVTDLGVRAYLGVPLVIEGEVIGSFCAVAFEPRHWTDADIAVMSELAMATLQAISSRQASRAPA